MRKKPFIIALTGPSACGKTYITDQILELGKQLREEGIDFQPKRFFKYVTRLYRETEMIDKLKGRDIDVETVRSIPLGTNGCELVYRTYGEEYGLRIKDLRDMLNINISPIVVVNDVRVVEELKREFNEQVLSLFIFRDIIPDIETHTCVGDIRGGGSKNVSITRFEKAVALYRVFIENIFIFDRVILNIDYEKLKLGENYQNIAHIQTEKIIRGVIDKKIILNKEIKKSPKLFIISGNAASGKDDIIKAANKMGRLQTDILKKYTTRWQEIDDENEIICKYIPKEIIIAKYSEEYKSEILKFEKEFTYTEYMKNYERECTDLYSKKDEEYHSDCNFDEFCEARYLIYKLAHLNVSKNGIERFWDMLMLEQDESSIPQRENPSKKELSKDEYLRMRDKYFERNPECLELDTIKEENSDLIKYELSKMGDKTENLSFCLMYEGREFIFYENNNLYGEPLNYGFKIGEIRDNWTKRKKHLVLTASLPNIFKLCKEIIGAENVITAFTYSQISPENYTEHADRVMGQAKLREYEDILRYANHIVDFDYALIYAETSLVNKMGNQKDELVDQMFRLFRAYNE
jgi:hypothetical protein